MPAKQEEDVAPTTTSETDVGVAPEATSETDVGGTSDKKQKLKKGCNTDQILAVLAHELGHWKLSHNLKNLMIGEVATCSQCRQPMSSLSLSLCS